MQNNLVFVISMADNLYIDQIEGRKKLFFLFLRGTKAKFVFSKNVGDEKMALYRHLSFKAK
jgi:hypothetical protein